MPKKKIITKKEIQTSLNTLPLKDFLSIIDEYSKTNGVDKKVGPFNENPGKG